MFKMKDTVTYSYRDGNTTAILFFKPNEKYGFYHSGKNIHLKEFADEVEKVEIMNFTDKRSPIINNTYCSVADSYLKVYYKDGSFKILDFYTTQDYEYVFFEVDA